MVAPARKIAFKVLQKVAHEKANSTILLDSYFRQESPSQKDRHLATQMVYGTLRWQNRLDYIISHYSHISFPKIDEPLIVLLRLALYQIFFLDRVPESAAVSDAVELSKKVGHRGHTAFANALLRKICQEKDKITLPSAKQSPKDYLIFTLSHPQWLVERWLKRWGYNITEQMLEANNIEAPIYARVNTIKISKESLREKLQAEGVEIEDCPLLPDCFKLKKPHLWESESLKKGYFYILDAASQIIALLLAPEKNQLILDACSAPGGKTACLAFDINQQGKIIANDFYWGRIKELKRTLNRLGIHCASIVRGDIERQCPFMPVFDRILVDSPCSALGRIRRAHEIKWNRRPEDISKIAQRQRALLEKASEALKPGGLLVYSVCTLEKEENEEIIYSFLEKRKGFRYLSPMQYLSSPFKELVDADGFLRTFPHRHNMDGFFAALLTRE